MKPPQPGGSVVANVPRGGRPATAPKPEPGDVRTGRIVTTLLGEFGVGVGGATIDPARWKLKHPRLLWQMLCLAPGHRVSRDEAAEALWPQASAQASSNRLHHTLHALRRLFSDAGLADARRLVQLQAGTLWLDPGVLLDLDVQRFAQAVAAARAYNGSDAALAPLECAREIHRGELALPARAGEWFTPYRRALLRDRVWVLEQLTHRHRTAGRVAQARQACRDLVLAEPSNEAAHRLLIELHHAEGRPDLAAQQYAECRRHLRHDLGVEPSAMTRQLIQGIAAQARQRSRQDELPVSAPGQRVGRRFVAPPRATPLLGREAELGELQRWVLEEAGARLITIVAAGGIGKTRLAAALAEQAQDRFDDGVCFVAIGESQQPLRLAETVCRALALSAPERTAEELLAGALADKHLLLVLDRFEHVIEAAPQLAMWLQAAPRLHIAVTSQCPLKSRAERVFELQPLRVHAPQAAIELFVHTARRAGVDVSDAKHESAIRSVCERVGGNTLAIELAAAQLPTVALAGLSSALLRPLAVLVGPSPDDEPQHASLQATIDWSVSLLPPGAARMLALTAVFAGDFSAGDVQSVLAPFLDTAALQPLLRTLLDRHLLFRCDAAADVGSGRFARTDAVREHAQRMAAGLPAWPQVQDAHLRHFVGVTERTLERARTNHYPQLRSFFLSSAADIEQALQQARQQAQVQTYLRACWQFASLQLDFGTIRRAIDLLEEALAVPVCERGERNQSDWCRYMLGCALGFSGDNNGAMKQLHETRRLTRGSSDHDLHMRLVHRIAYGWYLQSHFDKALKAIEGLIQMAERFGHVYRLGGYYLLKSACLADKGQYARATEAAQRALHWSHRNALPRGALMSLNLLAQTATSRGELDLAEQHLQEAQWLCDTAYSAVCRFDLLLIMGELAFERRSFTEADQRFDEALAGCQSSFGQRALVARLSRDFVLMETGRQGEAHDLLGLTEQELAMDNDYIASYIRARVYRLQLQAVHGDWSALRISVVRLQAFVKQAGNAVWASWLAESAAIAAHCIGQPTLARRLLGQSKALQAQAGVVATPRQAASWAQTQARLRQTPALTRSPERIKLTRLLAALSQEWPGGGGPAEEAVASKTRRGAAQQRQVPAAA
jgi:DNA-binding SARP family transcriptional activator/predicted ATPase